MSRKKTESRRANEFAALLAVAGLVFASFALWRRHEMRGAVAAGAGLAALALAVFLPAVWLGVFRVWMTLGAGLGWVTTRVILTVFYVAIVTPFGWVRRRIGKPTLDTAWRGGTSSYWVDREPVDSSIDRYAKRY